MTALERIKDCEKAINFANENGSYPSDLTADYKFILKAFHVMRKIAVENTSPHQDWDEFYGRQINKEFEAWME